MLPRHLLALALLPTLASSGDLLRPAAREGLVLRKTLTLESTRRFVSLDLSMDGEPLELPAASDDLVVERDRTIELTDRVTASVQGFATALERTFTRGDLEQLSKTGDRELATRATTPLVGRCARLAAAGGGWTAAWCGDEVQAGALTEPELLLGLEGALDLAEFLPRRAVSEGDTWEVPAAAYRVLHAPGGALGFAWEDATLNEARAVDRLEAALLDALTGGLRATHGGHRSAGDGELAVVALEGRIEANATVPVELGPESNANGATQRQTWTFDLAGELLWDVAAGRAVSLELAGPLTLEQVTLRTIAGSPSEHTLVETMRFEGDLAHAVAFALVR